MLSRRVRKVCGQNSPPAKPDCVFPVSSGNRERQEIQTILLILSDHKDSLRSLCLCGETISVQESSKAKKQKAGLSDEEMKEKFNGIIPRECTERTLGS